VGFNYSKSCESKFVWSKSTYERGSIKGRVTFGKNGRGLTCGDYGYMGIGIFSFRGGREFD
jgi:hypothetical protein